MSAQDSECVLGRCGNPGVWWGPHWVVYVCRALVHTGEVCNRECEHTGVIRGHAGTVWNVTGEACVQGSGCTLAGGMCMWRHLCFGGGLGRPSAEPGSAVPSLVAKSLKSLPFQQQLSRRRSSSDLGGEGGRNEELSGEGGGRG